MSKITNDRLNPVWHRMLYSCANMAAVGVKGLTMALSIPSRCNRTASAYFQTDRQTDGRTGDLTVGRAI